IVYYGLYQVYRNKDHLLYLHGHVDGGDVVDDDDDDDDDDETL
ncbi:unnamed protein product, partial [Rotaria magnacalcarata]